ncbi:MAG: hypothetical protein MI974_31345 [Chitinophagales bacterium]|nr:hypothetical protein [Chitinophagales bacterium]
MLKIENAIFGYLLESVVVKYNAENGTEFDGKTISQKCSLEIMSFLSTKRRAELQYRSNLSGRILFDYSSLSVGYLYKKGKEVRNRKIDIPIQSEDKYVETFVNYLGFEDIDSFFDHARAKIITTKKVNIKISSALVTPIQQYLLFFKEYTKNTKAVEIKINIREVHDGIEITYDVPPTISEKDVSDWFAEYMMYLQDNIDDQDGISIDDNSILNHEQKLFLIRLENEINHLKSSLKMAQLENQMLQNQYKDIKQIAMELSTKEMVVHNQYIQGGKQQFANTLNNKNEN